MSDLLDQAGYIFRMGASDAMRWNGLLIRGRHCRLIVNDDFWKGVQHAEAREVVDDTLGDPSAWRPIGAIGQVEICAYGKDDSSLDPVAVLRRIEALHPDSTVAFVMTHIGVDIRRVSFAGCRWGPPEIRFERRGRPIGRQVARITVDFKAEQYSDDALVVPHVG